MDLRQSFLFRNICWCALFSNLWIGCTGTSDYYTSPVGIQKLVKAEQKLLVAASEYAAVLESRINKINRYLQDYENSVVARMQSESVTEANGKSETRLKIYDKESDLTELSEKVAAHPLVTYRLLRRFALELTELEKDVSNNNEKSFLVELEKVRKGLLLPRAEDVNGAIEGLLRVQDAYSLNVTEFSEGNFMGLDTHSGLTANDCYQVGLYALQSQIYIRAVEWLERSYLILMNENDSSVDPAKVKRAYEEAIRQHDKVQRSNPQHLHVFNKPIVSISEKGRINETLRRAFAETKHILYQETDSLMDLWNFAALCSGKVLRSETVMKDLTCSYEASKEVPILAEKIERLSLDPPVIQIYDVISDSDIEKILSIAAPLMSRSKVQGSVEKKETASAVRTSSTTWLPEIQDPILTQISRRVQAISGLKVLGDGFAEDLQISSYGIGGSYNPHFDTILDGHFAKTLGKDEIFRGDRIATFMFYLSTLEKGGGTAFPRLGVVTEPIRKSGVFWFNLRRDGTRHPFSLHGGCPVLYGTKHVANKWIRANPQMFTRQCLLHQGI